MSVLVGFLLAPGCSYFSQGISTPEDRHASISVGELWGPPVTRIAYLDQGWDATDSLWFYNTTQGSDLVPYELFLNLEQPNAGGLLFRENANMNRYRYLTQEPHWDNPDGLPVGFVKDSFRGKDFVGFTCAACHTAQLNHKGTGLRVDGAPALADMEGFLDGLEAALALVIQDPAAFTRLSARVLGADANPKKQVDLRIDAENAYHRLRIENRQNRSPTGRYGYGRVDAVGRIFNRVLSHVTPGDETNFNASNAPVSYPFLWDTPMHDFVQWNGLISNEKNQVNARNVGEAAGTFATFDLQTGHSSIVLRNLVRLERQLRDKLWSPIWPGIFPRIDHSLALKGREVFERYRCPTCHASIGDRTDSKRRVLAQLATLPRIGTDPAMATNATFATGRSGLFEGKAFERGGGRFERVAPVNQAMATAIRTVLTKPDYDKTLLRRWFELAYDLGVGLFDKTIKNASRHVDHVSVGSDPKPEYLAVYKARPLNGIWATAPYLHNGSAPNLYEMFLPSCSAEPIDPKSCRSLQFTVGSREFDPVKVGFETPDLATNPGLFLFDARLAGNSNAGHEYSTGKTPVLKLDADGLPVKNGQGQWIEELLPPITDAQRWALVEYLKTL